MDPSTGLGKAFERNGTQKENFRSLIVWDTVIHNVGFATLGPESRRDS